MVTYAPNTSVLSVIRNDPNIVDASAANLSAEARASMENRLELFEEAYPELEFSTEVGSNTGYTDSTGTSTSDGGVPTTTTTEVEPTTEESGTTTEESEVEYVD